MRHAASLLLLATSALTLSAPLLAQEKRAENPKSHKEAMVAEVEQAWVKPPVEEASAVSKGTAVVRGAKIPYTATAGTPPNS